MINYYFTTYGDVYAGQEFFHSDFQNDKVIVQADKWSDFNELLGKATTPDKIKEYAWIIPPAAYVGYLKGTDAPKFRNPVSPDIMGYYERKDMFIIGAGASANCVTGGKKTVFKNDALRPPLGNELFHNKFENIYKKYDGVKLSLFDLQQHNVNIEECLENDWKEIQENGNLEIMKRHINIQFYLQELLKDVSLRVCSEYYDCNLFARLADKLQRIHNRALKNRWDLRRQFAFVSFNQDNILDHFLSSYFQKKLPSINNYIEINNSPFCLFKPHGSWNWGWKFPDKKVNRASTLFNSNINFYRLYFELLGKRVDMVDWNSWGLETSFHKHYKGRLTIDKSKLLSFTHDEIGNYYPAILLPYRDKDEFTMPPSHFYILQHYLSQIENLIVVGWKGNEALFTKMLASDASRIKKVIIVDPNPKIVEEHLKPVISRNGVQKINYPDFEDFVINHLEKEMADSIH